MESLNVSNDFNLYAELGDDVDFSSAQSLSDAITQRISYYNKSKRPDVRQRSATMLPQLKAVRTWLASNSDSSALAQIKALYLNGQKQEQKGREAERESKIQEIKQKGRILAPNGLIAKGTLEDLAKAYERWGISEDEILNTIHAKVDTQDQEDDVPALNDVAMDSIDAQLRFLGKKNLYEVLGVAQDAPLSKVVGAVDALNKFVSETLDKTSPEVKAKTVLVQQCNSIFRDDASRRSYNKAMYNRLFAPAYQMLRQLSSGGSVVLDANAYQGLLKQSVSAGIPEKEADKRIKAAWSELIGANMAGGLAQLADPYGLKAQVQGRIVSLSWEKGDAANAQFVVVRKENSMPSSPTDGVQIGTTSDSVFQDSDVEPGKSYFYAVYAKSGSKYSNAAQLPGPVFIVPPLSADMVQADVQETQIQFTFKQMPALKAYEISRNGAPAERVASYSFLDRNLTTDRDYDYSIVAVYADPAGLEHRTAPFALRLTPMSRPTPVDLLVTNGDNCAILTWNAPARGVVSIYYSDKPMGCHRGDLVNVAEKGWNKREVAGNSLRVDRDYSGIRYYVAVNVNGSMAVAGEPVSLVSLTAVPNASIVREDSKVVVTWDWTNCEKVRIEYVFDGFAPKVVDVDKASKPKAECDMPIPTGARSAKVSIATAVNLDGQQLLGEAYTKNLMLKTCKLCFESVSQVKKMGFIATNKYILTLKADSPLPCGAHVLVSEGSAPMDLVNYRPAAQVSSQTLEPGVSVPVTVEYDRRQKGAPLYFRVIAADRSMARSIVITNEIRNI